MRSRVVSRPSGEIGLERSCDKRPDVKVGPLCWNTHWCSFMMQSMFTRTVQGVDLLRKNVQRVPRARFAFSFLRSRIWKGEAWRDRIGRVSRLGIWGYASIGSSLDCWLFHLPRGFEWPFNSLLVSSPVAV